MFVLLVPVIIVFIYLYITKNFDYWKKRNVKYEHPVPLFGNIYRMVTGKRSITEIATEIYNKYPDEKVVGMFHGTTPELIIRDLDIAKAILNVDFAYFYPRGLGRGPEKEPLFLNLFQVDGDKWKLLRQRMTPAFTTAKLKKMFPLIIECAEKLKHVGEDIVNNGGECDIRELMARFTTEFIGACGFGLQVDAINNENSLFRSFGRKIFTRNRSLRNIAIVALYEILPDFGPLLQTIFHDPSLLDTTLEIFEGVRKQRNYKPSGRNDFIDLLLELGEKGKITGESVEKKGPDGSPVQVEMEMDVMCMAAQMFVFFAAGFETSSSATSYMLHELAFNPEEQLKIQEDIDRVLAKYDNKLCFDSIADMSLLSNGFKEAMRKFPSLGNLHRICAKRYTIPDVGITIDPGVKIIIPLQGIQNDEKYFEDPTAFKPERFAQSGSESRHKYAYLPFGEGPRMCIGARLGEMQSLAGLAALLHNFSVEPSIYTKRELEVKHTSNVVQSIEGGLPLKLKLRNKDFKTTA